MTIATNMAGRGTDIILGGNTDYMARLKVREVLLPRWCAQKRVIVRRSICSGSQRWFSLHAGAR